MIDQIRSGATLYPILSVSHHSMRKRAQGWSLKTVMALPSMADAFIAAVRDVGGKNSRVSTMFSVIFSESLGDAGCRDVVGC